MVCISCPFCDSEIELDSDLFGEYLCPMCDETLLYDNGEMLDEPIVLRGSYTLLTRENFISAISLLVMAVFTFGIVALIVLFVWGITRMSEKKEIEKRRMSGDPYPEKIQAAGIRIEVNKKIKLLHRNEKKLLEFYPNELTQIEHTQRYHSSSYSLFSGDIPPRDDLGSIKIFLNGRYACNIVMLTTKDGENICRILNHLFGVPHSIKRKRIVVSDTGGDGGGGGG